MEKEEVALPNTEAELIRAVQYGHYALVEATIERGVLPASACDSDNCSLLHWAAINNKVAITQYLLSKQVDVNVVGGINQETPLQWCVRNPKCTRMCEVLLLAGANVHYKSKYDYDALFIAVQCGHVNLAYLLLALGYADVNTQDTRGDTPLYWLLKNQIAEARNLQRLLLSFDASITHRNKSGGNAFHILCGHSNADYQLLEVAFSIYMKQWRGSQRGDNSKNNYANFITETHQHACCSKGKCGVGAVRGGGMEVEGDGKIVGAAGEGGAFDVNSPLVHAKMRPLLAAKNSSGFTPLKVAQLIGNQSMTRFLMDAYLYTHLPYWAPILSSALSVLLFFVILHYAGWFYGSVIYLPIYYLLVERAAQSMLVTQESRLSFGYAWGVIASIEGSYFVFYAKEMPLLGNCAIICLCCLIAYTLVLSSTTVPQHLPRSPPLCPSSVPFSVDNAGFRDAEAGDTRKLQADPNRDWLVSRITRSHARQGHSSGSYGSSSGSSSSSSAVSGNGPAGNVPGNIPESAKEEEEEEEGGENFNLCCICLTDKSRASTHCARCDRCVVALDHHCVYVNNCVGRGNRRVFVFFTLSASFGCALFFALSIVQQYNTLCPALSPAETHKIIRRLVLVQGCMLGFHPALAMVTYLSIATAIWIFMVFAGQLQMIASETTTFEVLKKKNYGNFSCTRCWHLFAVFFATGKYSVLHRNSARKQQQLRSLAEEVIGLAASNASSNNNSSSISSG